jgi:hypothetical protein
VATVVLAAFFLGIGGCGGSAKTDPIASPSPGGAAGQATGNAQAGHEQAGAETSQSGASGSNSAGGASSTGGSEPLDSAGAAGARGVPCDSDGVVHEVGVQFPCDCSICWCGTDGYIWSTLTECPPSVACTHAGKSYPTGVTFPSRDGCNECTCEENGTVGCTDKACACKPDAEWYRHYVLTDAQSCQAAKYACPPNTRSFRNECGCGCEEAAECAETIACKDCDDQLARCPYAKVSTP